MTSISLGLEQRAEPLLPHGKHSMAFLALFTNIFGCFTAPDEDQTENKPFLEPEDVPYESITDNAEVLDEVSYETPTVWPPRKHKDQMIAMMAEYWDQRIAEFEREQLESSIRATPNKAIHMKIECRNSIEV